ncbi:MAG: hypothetical protein J0J04_08140 [Microbacterium sp.]|uniref:hypothetical protein n=1 Tax=Microbacterium sp. TaxID=51671 RepID=UPI001ACB250F|nr:hypothetical protein [Microbacterium sp.]MBN9214770.1 hypothetical protein [Microbacterium sp.]
MIIDLVHLVAALGYGKTLMAVAAGALIVSGVLIVGAARRPGGLLLVAAGAVLLSVFDLDTFPEPTTATALLEGAS